MELHQSFAEKISVDTVENKYTEDDGSGLVASVSLSKRTGMTKERENSNSITCTPKPAMNFSKKGYLLSDFKKHKTTEKISRMKRKRVGNVEYANGTSKLAQENQANKRQKLDGGGYIQVPQIKISDNQNHTLVEIQEVEDSDDQVPKDPINQQKNMEEGSETRVEGQANQGGAHDTDVIDDNKAEPACNGLRCIIVGRSCAWLQEGGQSIPFNVNVYTVSKNGELMRHFSEGGPAQIWEPCPARLEGPGGIGVFFRRALPYILQTGIGLLIYMCIGALFYYSMLVDEKNPDLKGAAPYSFRDASYFLMVTMSSTGYGDICTWADTRTPTSPTSAKVIIIFMMLFGCGFLAGRLNATMSFFANALGNCFFHYLGQYMGGPISERSRVRWRFWSAVAVVLLCIGLGIIGGSMEKLGWVDSIYFSVATVFSVGYGDFSYSSPIGRLIAIWWLPFSTTVVSIAVGYLSRCGYWGFV